MQYLGEAKSITRFTGQTDPLKQAKNLNISLNEPYSTILERIEEAVPVSGLVFHPNKKEKRQGDNDRSLIFILVN